MDLALQLLVGIISIFLSCFTMTTLIGGLTYILYAKKMGRTIDGFNSASIDIVYIILPLIAFLVAFFMRNNITILIGVMFGGSMALMHPAKNTILQEVVQLFIRNYGSNKYVKEYLVDNHDTLFFNISRSFTVARTYSYIIGILIAIFCLVIK